MNPLLPVPKAIEYRDLSEIILSKRRQSRSEEKFNKKDEGKEKQLRLLRFERALHDAQKTLVDVFKDDEHMKEHVEKVIENILLKKSGDYYYWSMSFTEKSDLTPAVAFVLQDGSFSVRAGTIDSSGTFHVCPMPDSNKVIACLEELNDESMMINTLYDLLGEPAE